MRVLLDENLPHDLVLAIVGHDVVTVQGLGWAGVKNGNLLRQARGLIEAFVTMDANLEFQQRLTELSFGVVIIHAPSNRIADLLPVMPLVAAALQDLGPGTVRHIGAEQRAAPDRRRRSSARRRVTTIVGQAKMIEADGIHDEVESLS